MTTAGPSGIVAASLLQAGAGSSPPYIVYRQHRVQSLAVVRPMRVRGARAFSPSRVHCVE